MNWKVALGAVTVLALGEASTYGAERLPIQPLDYFATSIVLDPQISPNGKHIVYTRAGRDIVTDRQTASLWIIDADGLEDHKLVDSAQASGFRELNGEASGEARWSPSGDRIAFVGPTAAGPQIWIYDMATRSTKVISHLALKPERLAWAPDGSSLAFLLPVPETAIPLPMPAPPAGSAWRGHPKVIDTVVYRYDGGGDARPMRRHLFVISASGGEPRGLSHGPISFGGYGGFGTTKGIPSWTPDGRSIVISGRPPPDDSSDPTRVDIFRVDVASGTTEALTKGGATRDAAALSPDGTHIAYLGYPHTKASYTMPGLWVTDANGQGERNVAASLDRPVDGFAWERGGRSLIVVCTGPGHEVLSRLFLDGRPTEPLALDIGAGNAAYLGDGDTVSTGPSGSAAFSIQDATSDGDLAVLENGRVRRLTNLNSDLMARRELATTQERWSKSSYDRRSIQSFLIKPPEFDPSKRYPVIVEMHGGPWGTYGDFYDYEKQRMAAAGYVVLLVNYRGSIGYGSAFSALLEHDFPNAGLTGDVLGAVEDLAREPWIDARRVFIAGGSGGGTSTAWLIGNSSRFRAAAVYYPVIDFQSWALTADMPYRIVDQWMSGTPWQAREEYWRRSPLRLAPETRTPTLLLVGDEDWRTPASQTEEYFTALKLSGVETRLVRFPHEGHGLSDIPSDRIAKVSAILDWFGKHGGEPVQAPAPATSSGMNPAEP